MLASAMRIAYFSHLGRHDEKYGAWSRDRHHNDTIESVAADEGSAAVLLLWEPMLLSSHPGIFPEPEQDYVLQRVLNSKPCRCFWFRVDQIEKLRILPGTDGSDSSDEPLTSPPGCTVCGRVRRSRRSRSGGGGGGRSRGVRYRGNHRTTAAAHQRSTRYPHSGGAASPAFTCTLALPSICAIDAKKTTHSRTMHPLMTSVLAQRQLNAAGQLFTLSDYDVITDLVRYFV
ncbi:hypothetical protein Y032_0064g3546 [Ancylostoma ceylanicum]|nr:hypothetical protein Y032_0064g3546 [Ancylostoma ceylanicum]